MNTPRTGKALGAILEARGESMSAFAQRINFARSQVTQDINGQRSMSDSRFQAYFKALRSKQDRAQLIAARMRDLLPNAAADYVDLVGSLTFPDGLPSADVQALQWLAKEIATDPDMAALIRTLCTTWGMK